MVTVGGGSFAAAPPFLVALMGHGQGAGEVSELELCRAHSALASWGLLSGVTSAESPAPRAALGQEGAGVGTGRERFLAAA